MPSCSYVVAARSHIPVRWPRGPGARGRDNLPDPGSGEVRIKVLAAGTGFTDSFIRRGRYPDFKGPLPFTPGYDLSVSSRRPARAWPRRARARWSPISASSVAMPNMRFAPRVSSCLFRTASIRRRRCASRSPTSPPSRCSPAVAACRRGDDPRDRRLGHRRHGAARSGAPFRPQGDRHLLGRKPAAVERFGATAIDYRAGDFVASVRQLTAGERRRRRRCRLRCDRRRHFGRSFACLAPGGLLVGYGSQTMAIGRESLIAAGLGLARLKLWGALSVLFSGRRALFYSITTRRLTHPEEFKADMATLFGLLRDGAIHPVVVDRLPLAAASESMRASMPAGSAARSCCCLGWRRNEPRDHRNDGRRASKLGRFLRVNHAPALRRDGAVHGLARRWRLEQRSFHTPDRPSACPDLYGLLRSLRMCWRHCDDGSRARSHPGRGDQYITARDFAFIYHCSLSFFCADITQGAEIGRDGLDLRFGQIMAIGA